MVGVARVRALETEQEDALFRRAPLAQAFAAAGGLLFCLPEDAIELLPARISAQSAAGSRMGLTWGSRGVIEHSARRPPTMTDAPSVMRHTGGHRHWA